MLIGYYPTQNRYIVYIKIVYQKRTIEIQKKKKKKQNDVKPCKDPRGHTYSFQVYIYDIPYVIFYNRM